MFFIAVTGAYFLLPHRFRWMLLLGASMIFYAAFLPKYLVIIFALALVDYLVAIWIDRVPSKRGKKWVFIISIIANLGTLGFFKYANFFAANLNALADLLNWNYGLGTLSIILPIGISFHTFQGMSYVFEVYRGTQKVERHFGFYFLYAIFYPQLVAGPIERPGNLLRQFYEVHKFSYQRVSDGIKLMLWGLFKKAVIADRLAILVNQVYTMNNPLDFDAFTLLVATIFFSFQIYCDFSGYTDIARGTAHVMGFRLMENFRRPYHAKSIAEFWSRWHISLSSWLRDYLYIPLGGNRVSVPRWYVNIVVTFLLSGFWHGANWTFLAWGLIHGFYIVISNITRGLRARTVALTRINAVPFVYRFLQTSFIFMLVTIGWIFFRAGSLEQARGILAKIAAGIPDMVRLDGIISAVSTWRLSGFELVLAIVALAAMEVVHFMQRTSSIIPRLRRHPAWLRWTMVYALLSAIYFFGIFDEIEFIYFQF